MTLVMEIHPWELEIMRARIEKEMKVRGEELDKIDSHPHGVDTKGHQECQDKPVLNLP